MAENDPVVIDVDVALASGVDQKLKNVTDKLNDVTKQASATGSAVSELEVAAPSVQWEKASSALDTVKSKAMGVGQALFNAFVPSWLREFTPRLLAVGSAIKELTAATWAWAAAMDSAIGTAVLAKLTAFGATAMTVIRGIGAAIAGSLPLVAAIGVAVGVGLYLWNQLSAAVNANNEALERGEELDRQRLELRKKLVEQTNALIRADGQREASRAGTTMEVAGMIASPQAGQRGIDSARSMLTSQIDTTTAERNRWRTEESVDSLVSGDGTAQLENQVSATQTLLEANRSLLSLREKEFEIQKSIVQKRIEEIDSQRKLADDAQAILAQQEQREQSLAETLGRMNEARREQVKLALDAFEANKTDQTAAQLEGVLGGRTSITSDFYASQVDVKGGGFDALLEKLTAEQQATVDAADKLAASLGVNGVEALIAKLQAMKVKETAALEDLEKSFAEDAQKLGDTIIGLVKELAELREKVDEAKREAQTQGV